MKERRVVVTGAGGVTAFGNSWDEIKPRLQLCRNAVRRMTDWDVYKGLNARIAAPVEDFTLPDTYTRKKTRSMGRVSKLAVRSSEFALESAGLINDPVLSSGRMGVAFGSCCGSLDGVMEFGGMLLQHDTNFVNGTTYVRMMPHTAAVNVSLFFGITGRVIPTSSACTSGSQAIGYAAEAIRYGQADLMIAGGAEELSPADTAAFDALFAASTKNETPELTPSPFDKDRDGLVIGEGGAALVLEEYEHAKARGATILGEVAGFATNCDATHITSPNRITMEACLRMALESAGVPASEIGYVNAHGTGTARGDEAESFATAAAYGSHVPVSTLKSYFGHTLGACGVMEAWLSLMMMRDGWFSPTLNLVHPDPACAELDHITGSGRNLDISSFASNNFAFGGVNTSLLFKRVP